MAKPATGSAAARADGNSILGSGGELAAMSDLAKKSQLTGAEQILKGLDTPNLGKEYAVLGESIERLG